MMQARALEACDRAGVEVVIMSGRRESTVSSDARLMGQSSYIYEAGCGVMIDGERTYLIGDWTPDENGTPADKMLDAGLPELLFDHFGGRLEWHAPWHTDRHLSQLLRGLVDVDEANRADPARGRPRRPALPRQRHDQPPDGGDRGIRPRLPPGPGGVEQGGGGRLPHARPRLRPRGLHRGRRLARGPRRRRAGRALLHGRQRPRARRRRCARRSPASTRSRSPRARWATASTRPSSRPSPQR